MSSSSALCGICAVGSPRYRCPTCVIPYCSVACFKKHKLVPCTKPQQAATQSTPQPSALAPVVDEEDEHRYVVSVEQFGRLRGNTAITEPLRDRRLQQLIKSIDAHPQPDKAIAEALENPDFAEFVDEILRTIGVRDEETGECLI